MYGLFHLFWVTDIIYLSFFFVSFSAAALPASVRCFGHVHSPHSGRETSGRETLGSLAQDVANKATADNTTSLVSFVFIDYCLGVLIYGTDTSLRE